MQQPRLDVYATNAGMSAKPVRSFPAPRQLTIMQTGDDGSLYIAGPDIYKVNVQTGKFDVLVPSRHWKRPLYSAPDVLYVWNQQTYRHDFSLLYTAAKFKDKKEDPATADYVYGFFNIDLATGKTKTVDFGPLTEIYFSGMVSPKDPNLVFGVLNRLAKYDIKQKKMLQAATLDHSYYCISFNKAGSKIYLAGTFNDVAIFDADSLKPLGKIKLPGVTWQSPRPRSLPASRTGVDLASRSGSPVPASPKRTIGLAGFCVQLASIKMAISHLLSSAPLS